VRRWIAETDKRNFDIADELVATDYIDHNPPLPGTAPGREGVKQANAMLYAAFPEHPGLRAAADLQRLPERGLITSRRRPGCRGTGTARAVRLARGHRPRSRGSKISRTASPNRLNP
jgi:hypothetical protein